MRETLRLVFLQYLFFDIIRKIADLKYTFPFIDSGRSRDIRIIGPPQTHMFTMAV